MQASHDIRYADRITGSRHSSTNVCMYVCMYDRIYNALNANSLSSHECTPVGQTNRPRCRSVNLDLNNFSFNDLSLFPKQNIPTYLKADGGAQLPYINDATKDNHVLRIVLKSSSTKFSSQNPY